MNPNRTALKNDFVTIGDGLSVSFLRTLRIPDDGKTYPLPPGLGRFPVRRVDDYADKVPAEWREHGGVFLPMYQREAMWISFAGQHWKPRAVKVSVGKVCALTGERWTESLASDPQNYVVTPPQPWLDGVAVKRGVIRQFVAMPLGLGYTVEGQVTGEESVGGLQLKVFEPKQGRFPDQAPPSSFRHGFGLGAAGGMAPPAGMPAQCGTAAMRTRASGAAMGLAAGGRMKQSVYPDPHGIDTWDPSATSRVFVHIVNSSVWREITGEEAPSSPITARNYASHGLPWFGLYDEGLGALSETQTLATVKSVSAIDEEKSKLPLQDDAPVEVGPMKKFLAAIAGVTRVRDGKW